MTQSDQHAFYNDVLNLMRVSPDGIKWEPVKDEIYSVERLEEHARQMARELDVELGRRGRPLSPALRNAHAELLSAYSALTDAIRSKQPVSPAAEWFVDNFHIVEDQLRDIREHLPPRYYQGLPKIAAGPLKGHPRVYALALSLLVHTDCRLDVTTLRRFVKAFQEVSPLSIGELWAISISLRLALIEFLKPLTVRIVRSRKNRDLANELADRLLKISANSTSPEEDLTAELRKFLSSPEKFDRAYIVQLVQRLRDQDSDVWPAYEWIEEQLKTQSTDTFQLTQLEHQRQAAAQVTVGNIISSMRLLSALDWKDFFESVSRVDEVLARDPEGAYPNMEFVTRDRYRHEIERLSRRSDLSEIEIAEKVVARCGRVGDDIRARHVGFHLIGEGIEDFEKELAYAPRLAEKLGRAILRSPIAFYLSWVFGLSAAIIIPALYHFSPWESALWQRVLWGILLLVPVSEFSLAIVNYVITRVVRPEQLPKMDMTRGIPAHARTMVVVPTLFTSVETVKHLVEELQIRYLANRDQNIYFTLLGDFADASSQEASRDLAILQAALEGIEHLNREHPSDGFKRFHVLTRRRLWCESEGKWMGWERKRGKIEEFNRLLRGDKGTSFETITAPTELLGSIKYVITLDSDTQLPRDSARRLVGCILHPLNRPGYDKTLGRVSRGYSILQPRISVALAGSLRTRFSKIFAGHTGIDPYTTAVSDVYQDLFREGSFTGKGLYDVDAFQQSLEGKVPESALLSHDLFEGCFARCGLVTDVELFDDYPADFGTYVRRLHRWTRGDWQVGRWILPKVPDASRQLVRNLFSRISRWKIADNLRRSLYAPTFFVSLFLAWTVFPEVALAWTTFLLLLPLVPLVIPLLDSALSLRKDLPVLGHLRNLASGGRDALTQYFSTLVFLPELAWTQVDAILRALYRVNVSRKKILEWVSFAQDQGSPKRKTSLWEKVGPGPFLGATSLLALGYLDSPARIYLMLLPCLWILAPLLKNWLAQAPAPRQAMLTSPEVESLRLYARRTWKFFETFVCAEDNWLAPDNFQEDPKPVVAHRTSPTNIGLQLLSACSAYDMGYLTARDLADRLEKTFATMARMERLRGHFFNWYDTLTLHPLKPQYVSTVDSGNLAAHLLAVKQSCLDLADPKKPLKNSRQGVIDTLKVLREESSREMPDSRSAMGASVAQARELIALSLSALIENSAEGASAWRLALEEAVKNLSLVEDILETLGEELSHEPFEESRSWLSAALAGLAAIDREDEDNPSLHARFLKLAQTAETFVHDMDFAFLFDWERKIFVIGYNVSDDRRDNSFYDLLASESRLASFVAIAKGDVPQEHWFRLGRQLTRVKGGRALVSWTATMFEYLMPLLVTRGYRGTLLEETYHSVLARQIEYGKQRGVPWGVSEAGYNARDLHLNYQYGPFGIPGLGLKRGLSDELVVSPYSTMLAALVNPQEALTNLKNLEDRGALGRYGFYESIDYTRERIPQKQTHVILRSFMAHHQGMSFVALNNVLNQNIVQGRFHADPLVQSTELLLQERVPAEVSLAKPRAEEAHGDVALSFSNSFVPRVCTQADLSRPQTQILSNGNYSVLVSASGSGYSRCGRIAVNRWREDATRDHWGHFIYIRNRTSGSTWTTGHHPVGSSSSRYEVTFTEDKVDFWREDEGILTHTEILVAPEDNVELRRVSMANTNAHAVEIEVTSFMELALAPQADDAAHSAFSNLFVQTEFVATSNALLATRRKRVPTEEQICGFHVLSVENGSMGPLQYETDRVRFLGRGRSAAAPLVIAEARPLSNTVGSVLDPAFSLRRIVTIKAGETVRLCFATGVTFSRADALRLADKYHDAPIFGREAELAWTSAQVQLRHLNVSSAKAHVYQKLAGRIVYSDHSLRPSSRVLSKNVKRQSDLWAYGIGGDLPIVLTAVSEEKDMALVRDLLHAHEYLRLKGLAFDLVILNERPPSYFQGLQDEIQRQIRISGSKALIDKTGGVFVRRKDLMPEDDVLLLKTVARVSLRAEHGALEDQLKRRPFDRISSSQLKLAARSNARPEEALVLPDLQFFNGLGGFGHGGREYVIILKEGQWTPAPWSNVVANSKDFGFIVSESGSGCTWSVNSRENRLSPWSNDAVSDPPGEAIYVKDEESGEFWSPTPLPIRDRGTYVIRHGSGYTRFEHVCNGIGHQLDLFVPMDETVKISRLRLKNLGTGPRKLSVMSYVEWVLGAHRGASAPHVVTEVDPETGAIFARNPYNNEFAGRVAFADLSEADREYTCDRYEFLGALGSLAQPAAIHSPKLSASAGAGLDPCAVFRHAFELQPGEERDFVVLLGQADDVDEARRILRKFRSPEKPEEALVAAKAYWVEMFSALRVRTPDPAMNVMMNSWLLYQTLSCRIWARTAFYQSGGAFGFRDQLQDAMAMVYSQPEIARAHILKASARQFVEGDVQHWWHPPTGRGVRTRFSDDLLWLPYVTAFYVKLTGDHSILEEKTPFIGAPPLADGQDDSYTHPETLAETATVREHCARTLDRSLAVGRNGLPLMGSGDWNDGMSHVGHGGQGESVWVAWFLFATMKEFIPYLESAGETERVERYRVHLESLKGAVEKNAWDGDWYRRAYFDDGTPLGSASNEECRIDSIAQSWSVLSGAGDPGRSVRAMAAVDEFLIHPSDGLVKLFTPPFDSGKTNPGYIKGYVPGVRENGGQYTHAAIWTLMAFAELGDGDKAGDLYSLLNPINHASTRAGALKYKVEPYVAAADIYGLSPHVGRGGWTWYTGSASWMYRAGLESILGFGLRGDRIVMKPRVPSLWRSFEIVYKWKTSVYRITAIRATELRSDAETKLMIDGAESKGSEIPLVDDGKEHEVYVFL